MSAIPEKEWKKVIELYTSGLPMRAVAQHMGVDINAVVYVLRKTSTARRTQREANAIRFEATQPSFSINATRDKKLEAVGAALYWAEGHKTLSAAGIDFANSDPSMVELFIHFLRDRYTLDEKRLRGFLYCYENQDVPELINFWSRLLEIPTHQFTRPHIRHKPSLSARTMTYGMIHVRYSDKKMLRDMLHLIESYRLKYCVGGRVVNYTTL